MENDRSIRVQLGCAILFLFNLIALCTLLYVTLIAGFFFPVDCTTEHERACDAARATLLGWLAMISLTTVGVNVGFSVWVLRRPRRER